LWEQKWEERRMSFEEGEGVYDLMELWGRDVRWMRRDEGQREEDRGEGREKAQVRLYSVLSLFPLLLREKSM
jgi:hypothetical protein